jgi:ribosomal protein L37AE/L43A
MTTMQSYRRLSFGINCIKIGSVQVSPESAEYWTDRHAFHIWHCPKCTASLAIKDIRTVSDVSPSLRVA